MPDPPPDGAIVYQEWGCSLFVRAPDGMVVPGECGHAPTARRARQPRLLGARAVRHAGLLPWPLTGWETRSPGPPLQGAGLALIVGGGAVLLHAFARFVVDGLGTPGPVAPTERLVAGGLYATCPTRCTSPWGRRSSDRR
jgi:hypothetical protein